MPGTLPDYLGSGLRMQPNDIGGQKLVLFHRETPARFSERTIRDRNNTRTSGYCLLRNSQHQRMFSECYNSARAVC